MQRTALALLCAAALAAFLCAACDDGGDVASASASPLPESPAPPRQDEAAEWRSKYEDLINAQEALHIRFTGLKAENESLRGELDRVKAECDALRQKAQTVEKPPLPAAGTLSAADEAKAAVVMVVLRERLETLGRIVYDDGDLKLAMAILGLAIDAGSRSSETTYQLGRCLAGVANYEGAIERYESALAALRADPEADEALLKSCLINCGVAYQRLDRTDDAERAYLEALKLDPTCAPAHYNLGLLYAKELAKPEQAIEALRQHVVHGGNRGISARHLIEQLQQQSNAPASPTGEAAP